MLGTISSVSSLTVELQWLEYHWNNGNLFEIWVVQDTKGYSWRKARKQMMIILGCFFDLLYNIGMFVSLNICFLGSTKEFRNF